MGGFFCALRISALPEASYLYFKQKMMHLYYTKMRLALLCEAADVSTDLALFVKPVRPLGADAMVAALAGSRHVVVVSSARAGLGKTERVKALANARGCAGLKTVAVSGFTSRAELVGTLLRLLESGGEGALHLNVLDVPAECKEVVNDMLFELLTLSMVGSSAASAESLVHVPYNTVFVELANTVGSDLLAELPVCGYFKQERLEWNPAADAHNPTRPRLLEELMLVDPADVQIVCQYLQALTQGTIDTEEVSQTHQRRGLLGSARLRALPATRRRGGAVLRAAAGVRTGAAAAELRSCFSEPFGFALGLRRSHRSARRARALSRGCSGSARRQVG